MHATITGSRWVNLNGSHGNPRAHQARMDEWKRRGILAIRATKPKPVPSPVEITAIVRRTTRALSDAHNVTPTIKACIDAAVHCGVIEDDHDGIVRRLVITRGPVAKAPTIELIIRPLEES